MATDNEDSTSYMKGLSFIDWGNLENEEFVKLEKIIHDPKESPGVQLPFVPTVPKPMRSTENTVDIQGSVLQPSAPVFQPAIPPPPSIVGFPIPVPAWTHRDHGMASSGPPYPIPVHGGYVFQDPSMAVNGDVTMAFVTTLSNGQPVYALPGHHQIPPNFQPPPPHHHHHHHPHHHGGRVDCTVSHSGHMSLCSPHQTDLVMQPVSMSGAAMMTTSPTHPLVMGHGAPNMAHHPGHMLASAPVTVSPNGISPHHPETTQIIYANQLPPVQSSPPIEATVSAPHHQPHDSGITFVQTVPKAISGLPPRQKTPIIEFAGPVVFGGLASQSKGSGISKSLEKSKMDQVLHEGIVKDQSVNANSNANVKKSPMKEIVVDVKHRTHSQQPDFSPSTVSGTPRLNEIEESNSVLDKSSFTSSSSPPKSDYSLISSHPAKSDISPVSSTPVTSDHPLLSPPSKSDKSPVISPTAMPATTPVSSPPPKSVVSHDNNVNDANASISDTNDFPKMNATHAFPISTNTLPKNEANAKESISKEETATALPPSTPAPKMWSSLFGSKINCSKSNSLSTNNQETVLQTSLPSPSSSEVSVPVVKTEPKSVSYWQEQERVSASLNTHPEKLKPVVTKQDPLAPRLLEKLSNFPISHVPIVIQPRGLKNGKNTCFMNATLQVLMGCPPFIHLFRAFKNFPARTGSCSSTPVFDSLVLFVNSFQNGQRAKQGSRGKKGNSLDVSVGFPFSPDPLLTVAQDILGLNIGVQQDAEEFLSQILSICHEEMVNIIKMDKNMDSVNNNSHAKIEVAANGHVESFDDDDDDSWQQVGPKNHSVETNVNDCGQTPLSSIFAGLSRSCLQKESGKTSDTLDSFFTLKLDIQAENVHSVKEALLRLNTLEIVHDADGRKVHGQRRMFFDVLPPVLIMHLKLFEYSNGNGQKIQKKISFDVDLQIPKEILSRVGRTKYSSSKSRSYKLFGVVDHHGIRMNDGHYTSDVYLPVANGWLHFDDSDVSSTNEAHVLQHCEGSMPYMLFYRRLDTKE